MGFFRALPPPRFFVPKAYFEDNPRDLHVLRHDKPLHPAIVKPHLRNVPDYLGTSHAPIWGGKGAKRCLGVSLGGGQGVTAVVLLSAMCSQCRRVSAVSPNPTARSAGGC